MSKKHTVMTTRTFGLVLTLAIISVGAFTSALVLAYPNPNGPRIVAERQTDTRVLDKKAVAVNSSSTQPQQSTASQQVDANAQAASSGTPSQPSPTASSQPQTASSSPNPAAAQPPVAPQSQPNASTPPKQDQSLLGGIGSTLNQLLGSLLN